MTNFNDLPGELRNTIYQLHYSTNDDKGANDANDASDPTDKHLAVLAHPTKPTGAINLLLTSKQVYREARDYFALYNKTFIIRRPVDVTNLHNMYQATDLLTTVRSLTLDGITLQADGSTPADTLKEACRLLPALEEVRYDFDIINDSARTDAMSLLRGLPHRQRLSRLWAHDPAVEREHAALQLIFGEGTGALMKQLLATPAAFRLGGKTSKTPLILRQRLIQILNEMLAKGVGEAERVEEAGAVDMDDW